MSISATFAKTTYTSAFATGDYAIDTADAAGAACDTVATTAPTAVIAVRSINGPHERAVAMICRFLEWNATTSTTATADATTAATATAPAADTETANEVDMSPDAVSTYVTTTPVTATPVAAPVAAHVSADFQQDELGTWRDRTDEVVHISTACKELSRNRVEVAGVVLLGWTLRYRMRSTGTGGDWYATSPDGKRYRSHKELQRRV